jgi:nucleotide-binding universal stress UspA family protein
MSTFVLGVDDVHATARLCDYLAAHLGPADTVHAVNSLPGGDATDADDVRDGEDALNVASARLAGTGATVQTHQFVRGNDPVEDLLECAADEDADEFVVGTGVRNPTAKVVFGSVTRSLLLQSPLPVRVVPPAEA